MKINKIKISKRTVTQLDLSYSLTENKNLKYIKKVEKILKFFSEKQKEESVIGMLICHTSVESYVLITKKRLKNILEKEQKDYPKLSCIYFDFAWFRRKKERLRRLK